MGKHNSVKKIEPERERYGGRERERERERESNNERELEIVIRYVGVACQISQEFMVTQTQFLKLIIEKQLLQSDVDAPRLTRCFLPLFQGPTHQEAIYKRLSLFITANKHRGYTSKLSALPVAPQLPFSSVRFQWQPAEPKTDFTVERNIFFPLFIIIFNASSLRFVIWGCRLQRYTHTTCLFSSEVLTDTRPNKKKVHFCGGREERGDRQTVAHVCCHGDSSAVASAVLLGGGMGMGMRGGGGGCFHKSVSS